MIARAAIAAALLLIPEALAARMEERHELAVAGLPCTLKLQILKVEKPKARIVGTTTEKPEKELIDAIKPVILCSEPVKEAKLSVPRWKEGSPTEFNVGEIAKGIPTSGKLRPMIGPYGPEDTMMGETYELEATYGSQNERSSVSAVVTEVVQASADEEKACQLEKKLENDGTSYKVIIVCSGQQPAHTKPARTRAKTLSWSSCTTTRSTRLP